MECGLPFVRCGRAVKSSWYRIYGLVRRVWFCSGFFHEEYVAFCGDSYGQRGRRRTCHLAARLPCTIVARSECHRRCLDRVRLCCATSRLCSLREHAVHMDGDMGVLAGDWGFEWLCWANAPNRQFCLLGWNVSMASMYMRAPAVDGDVRGERASGMPRSRRLLDSCYPEVHRMRMLATC